MTGTTDSFDFPTTAGAFQPAKAAFGFDAFVTKVNASGTGLVYSTYLGGADFGTTTARGSRWTAAAWPTSPARRTPAQFPVVNAFQPVQPGGSDAFVTKLNATGSALVYSSHLGGGLDDIGYGIAVDASRAVHLVGLTSSSGAFSTTRFPITAGAFQSAFGGVADAFVARITGEDLPPPRCRACRSATSRAPKATPARKQSRSPSASPRPAARR